MLGRHTLVRPGLSSLGIEEQPPEIGRSEYAEMSEEERAAGGFTLPFFEAMGLDPTTGAPLPAAGAPAAPTRPTPPPPPIVPDLGPEEKGLVNSLINYYEKFDGPFDFFWKNFLGAAAIATAGWGATIGIKALLAKRALTRGVRQAKKTARKIIEAAEKKAEGKSRSEAEKLIEQAEKKADKLVTKAEKTARGLIGKAKKRALAFIGKNPYSPQAKYFHIRTADPSEFEAASFRVIEKRTGQDPESVQKIMVPKSGIPKRFHEDLYKMQDQSERRPFDYDNLVNKLKDMRARGLKITVAKRVA